VRATPQGIRLFTRPVVVAAPTSTTWAAATDWTLTNGNLTAERTGTADFWAPIKASAAKTNGTVIHTINAIGSAGLNSLGLSTGTVSGSLGSDVSGNDIGYDASGTVTFAGTTVAGGPYATWTTADVIKIVKAAGLVSFYKNNVLQVTVDTTSGTYGVGTIMAGNAYPAITTQHATGFKTTTDFSGW
jgi:hypothetical protein